MTGKAASPDTPFLPIAEIWEEKADTVTWSLTGNPLKQGKAVSCYLAETVVFMPSRSSNWRSRVAAGFGVVSRRSP